MTKATNTCRLKALISMDSKSAKKQGSFRSDSRPCQFKVFTYQSIPNLQKNTKALFTSVGIEFRIPKHEKKCELRKEASYSNVVIYFCDILDVLKHCGFMYPLHYIWVCSFLFPNAKLLSNSRYTKSHSIQGHVH